MTSDFKLTGAATGVADGAGVASWATEAATRGFFLQAVRTRQIENTAPNKRIDSFRSRFFPFGQRIPG
jgi:hypothetical protein